MNPSARPRHLSMIRGFHLADFLTLANAACGVLAVFAVMAFVETRDARWLLTGSALIPLAFWMSSTGGSLGGDRSTQPWDASSTRWPTSFHLA
jgi:CDP-diacylglycerol---serine O-phosphatidyltransferase